MHSTMRFPIRTSSFVSKEIFEILRQPQLIITLILAPFLILLLFGIGYRNEARPLRTLFVVPEDNALRQALEQQIADLGPQLVFSGMTNNESSARERLRRNEVDVVVVVPPDAYDAVRNSEQAVIALLHDEIDPIESDYIRVFGQVYVDEVNRRVLLTVTEQGQQDASRLAEALQSARANSATIRQALENGDRAAAATQARRLQQDIDDIDLLVGGSLAVLAGVREVAGSGSPRQSDITGLLDSVRQRIDVLADLEQIGSGRDALDQVRAVEGEIERLESELAEFQQVDPQVLVRPFRSETQSVMARRLRLSDFYAPSALVLLLQHFAVTFAGLSIVRERRTGAIELFQVAPLSAIETLLGKYISYVFFIGVIGLVLSLLLMMGLRVPMLGDWGTYALVILVLIFTSLGVGFLLSLIAENTGQAVQYAMILLLASVFFSGFFLSLEMLWRPIRILSWMLPATYGIRLLQDVMLRGGEADPRLLSALAGIGVLLFLLAWLLLSRRMARR